MAHAHARYLLAPRSKELCKLLAGVKQQKLSIVSRSLELRLSFSFQLFCILFVSFLCKFMTQPTHEQCIFRLSICHVFFVRSFSSRVPLIAPAWLRTPNTTNCTLDPKLRLSQTNDVIFVWRQQDNGYKIYSYVHMQLLCIVLCILRSHFDMIDHINCKILYSF